MCVHVHGIKFWHLWNVFLGFAWVFSRYILDMVRTKIKLTLVLSMRENPNTCCRNGFQMEIKWKNFEVPTSVAETRWVNDSLDHGNNKFKREKIALFLALHNLDHITLQVYEIWGFQIFSRQKKYCVCIQSHAHQSKSATNASNPALKNKGLMTSLCLTPRSINLRFCFRKKQLVDNPWTPTTVNIGGQIIATLGLQTRMCTRCGWKVWSDPYRYTKGTDTWFQKWRKHMSPQFPVENLLDLSIVHFEDKVETLVHQFWRYIFKQYSAWWWDERTAQGWETPLYNCKTMTQQSPPNTNPNATVNSGGNQRIPLGPTPELLEPPLRP